METPAKRGRGRPMTLTTPELRREAARAAVMRHYWTHRDFVTTKRLVRRMNKGVVTVQTPEQLQERGIRADPGNPGQWQFFDEKQGVWRS